MSGVSVLTRQKDSVSILRLSSDLSVTSEVVLKKFDASQGSYVISQSGDIVAVKDNHEIEFYSLKESDPKSFSKISHHGILSFHLSPSGRYVVTWQRKVGEEPNLIVWSVSDGTMLAKFNHKSYSSELLFPLAWTSDEKYCARMCPNEIVFYDGSFSSDEKKYTVSVPNVESFSISPTSPNGVFTLLTFVPRNKSQPASVSLWCYPNFNKPTGGKSLQADESVVKFSPDGTLALVLLSTLSSSTSYYGDSRLFLISRNGDLNVAISPKDGTVHDFCWAEDGNTFFVTAGVVPPISAVYSKRGALVYSFGERSFNTIRVSPNGKSVSFGGYGSLAGDMIFYDTSSHMPISTVASAPCTVTQSWSSDSRLFITATVRPRLQVDNGFIIWNYHGQKLFEKKFDHLHQVDFIPDNKVLSSTKNRSPSPLPAGLKKPALASRQGNPSKTGGIPEPSANAQKKPVAGAYVPPHLRNPSK